MTIECTGPPLDQERGPVSSWPFEIGYDMRTVLLSAFDLSELAAIMATATSTIRIGPADHGRTMSLDEFIEAELEEGYRYELARGVLEVTHVPR